MEWILLAALIFAGYVPYLLIYFPGFIFGDTVISFGQALGVENYNNHHPIVYTFFIKVCLKVGRIIFGSNTYGCAIYSVMQMLIIALGEAYIICWSKSKIFKGKNNIFSILFLLMGIGIYGGLPYFGCLSIAMWKDPLFSIWIVLLTIILHDIFGRIKNNKCITGKCFALVILAIATIFLEIMVYILLRLPH